MDGKKMPLLQHLADLRKVLVISALAILLCAVVGWLFYGHIIDVLNQPIRKIAAEQRRLAMLNFSTISGAFELRLQVSLTVGILLAAPVWLYELFYFFLPALNRREKKLTFIFFFTALPLFTLGVYSGWLVLPVIVEITTSFATAEQSAIIEAISYYGFVVKLMILTGVGFVLPVFLVILNMLGVLSAASIIKSWRIAVLVVVLFTAAATPASDVISMFLLAVPMLLIYFAAALVCYLRELKLKKRVQTKGNIDG